MPDGDVFLEVLAPAEPLDLTRAHQEVRFERRCLPVARYEAHAFAAARGHAGRDAATRIGDFYALVWRDAEGRWHRILDPLAVSLPFGAFAPAELYDVDGDAGRARRRAPTGAAWRGEAPHKFGPPTQHPADPRADRHGRRHAGQPRPAVPAPGRAGAPDLPLEPADELFLGYDAVQLLPVEPTTVYETGPDFWHETAADGRALAVDA